MFYIQILVLFYMKFDYICNEEIQTMPESSYFFKLKQNEDDLMGKGIFVL